LGEYAGSQPFVVDRQSRGSDTMSTHALMRAGVLQLERWSLLKRLQSEGTPPIGITTFHYGPETVPVAIKPEHGVQHLYAPRRTVLDRILVDAAEEGGAILFFDEADALFGKRSEVKDSHDRYANIEINYLLQRMEAYRGLAVLATNRKGDLDPAFMRRVRFVVNFPFPDNALRAEIWRRIFPASTPLDHLDVGKLSRLKVAGGNIRNIALNAAFLAAAAGETVGMSHLFSAAKSECAKIEKPVSEAEIGGWL